MLEIPEWLKVGVAVSYCDPLSSLRMIILHVSQDRVSYLTIPDLHEPQYETWMYCNRALLPRFLRDIAEGRLAVLVGHNVDQEPQWVKDRLLETKETEWHSKLISFHNRGVSNVRAD